MHSEIIGAASVPLRCTGKPQMNDVFSEAAEWRQSGKGRHRHGRFDVGIVAAAGWKSARRR